MSKFRIAKPPSPKAIITALLTLVATVSFYAQCGCSVTAIRIQASVEVEEWQVEPLTP